MLLHELNQMITNPMFMLGVLLTMVMAIIAVGIGTWVAARTGKGTTYGAISEEDYEAAREFITSEQLNDHLDEMRVNYIKHYGEAPKYNKVIHRLHIENEINYSLYLAIKKLSDPLDWKVTYLHAMKRIDIEIPLFD